MSRLSTPVENPPKSLSIEPYWKQSGHWPNSGPVILAQYDDETIVVYVETSKVVAARAVELQHDFRAGLEAIRVYTSFIRSQAHAEWNTKFDSPEKLHHQQKTILTRQQLVEGLYPYPFRKTRQGGHNSKGSKLLNNEYKYPQQRHTLAVRIRRSTFDKWIEAAVHPDNDVFDDGDDYDNTTSFNGWKFGETYWRPWASIDYDRPVYRWVNDIYPILPLDGTGSNQRLARKTLELYLYGKDAGAFVSTAETLSVEDITPFVDEIRARLTNNKGGSIKDIWSPSERLYVPSTSRILEE